MSIVEAPANQLGDKVAVASSSRGAEVSIVKNAIAPLLPQAAYLTCLFGSNRGGPNRELECVVSASS
jgi:hypothetical protein